MGKSLSGKNLGKGFTQRKDGLYQGTYYDGSGKRKFMYSSNITKLKREIRQKKKEIDEGDNGNNNPNPTFAEVYEEFYSERLLHMGFKNTTVNSYISAWKWAEKYIGSIPIKDFTDIVCERSVNKMLADYSDGTVGKMVNLMGKVFTYAADVGYIDTAPKIEKRKVPRKKDETQSLTEHDMELILAAEKSRTYRNLYIFAANTGMRFSEIAGLKVGDVDFKKKIIHIRRQIRVERDYENDGKYRMIESTPKTESSKSYIPMNPKAEAVLKDELSQSRYRSGEYKDIIFVGREGKPIHIAYINAKLKKIYGEIGDQLSVDRLSSHMFRHTFATNCMNQSGNIMVVQRLLRHSSIQSTQRYVHTDEDKLFNTVNSI